MKTNVLNCPSFRIRGVRLLVTIICVLCISGVNSMAQTWGAQQNLAGWWQDPATAGNGTHPTLNNNPFFNSAIVTSMPTVMSGGSGANYSALTSGGEGFTFHQLQPVDACTPAAAQSNNEYFTSTASIRSDIRSLRISNLVLSNFQGDGVTARNFQVSFAARDITDNGPLVFAITGYSLVYSSAGGSNNVHNINNATTGWNFIPLIPGHTYEFRWYINKVPGTDCSSGSAFKNMDNPSIDVQMMDPVSVSGTLFNDNNGTTGGANGTPVPAGTTVTLFAANGTTVVATTTTDPNGNYSFPSVVAGNYIVGVTPAAGFNNVSSIDASPTDGRIAVTIASTNVTGINFGINQPPTTTNNSLTGQTPGQPCTVPNILANDADPNGGTLSPANITLITPAGATGVTTDAQGDVTGFTVPGQGTWALNSTTGAVVFTPQVGFTADPTPISYTVADAAGLESPPAAITVDYNAPVAVSGTLFNDNNGATGGANGTSVPAGTTVTLFAGNGTTVIATATTNASGNYSFPGIVPGNYVVGVTPPEGFSNVSSTDATPGNGLTNITVGSTAVSGVNFGLNQPPVTANNSLTGQNAGQTATVPNILANDRDPNAGTLLPADIGFVAPAGATGVITDGQGDVTAFAVPGQGTWTLNTDGSVTFTPVQGFTADPTPVQYRVRDAASLFSNTSTISIDYNAPTPPVATDDSDTGNTPGADAIVNLLANDDLSDGSQATTANTSVALIAPAGGTLNPDGTVTVSGQGVWTYSPATGDLTFNPDAGFTGDPTPISYTLTETATGLTDNANVTVDYTQVILADYGDLPYSGATVNYPKVKASFTDADNNNVPDDAGAVWLGTFIDAEADGFTNPADPLDYGKGDDKSGVSDEDGLKVNGIMAPGTVTWTITANSNQPATVHYGMWVDWGTPTAGPDGTFDNFYSGTITTASPASQTVSVTVPASFQNGSVVNVRLIASTAPLDQATGFSTDLTNGEVEDFQFAFAPAMPVRLVSFQAKASEIDADLEWKATDQENFDRYEIERSLDGKAFSKIGVVASNNQAAGNYGYSDKAAAGYGHLLYYRLKMVDTDGSFSYSVMRPVRFGDVSASSIYPNPVIDKLHIRVKDWKLVKSLRIDNLAGLQVYSSGPVQSGALDVTSLGTGIHILRITFIDGSVQTQKFVRIK